MVKEKWMKKVTQSLLICLKVFIKLGTLTEYISRSVRSKFIKLGTQTNWMALNKILRLDFSKSTLKKNCKTISERIIWKSL